MICFIWFWCTFAFLSPAVSGCDCYRIFSALSLLWTDFAYFHPPRWFLRNAITGVNAIPMQMIVGNCEWRHYLLREIKHLLKSRIISKFPTNIVCPHLRVNLNTLILTTTFSITVLRICLCNRNNMKTKRFQLTSWTNLISVINMAVLRLQGGRTV